MTRSILIIATTLALFGGCAPAPSSSPSGGSVAATDPTLDIDACRAAGGILKPVGRLQTVQCVVAYADAGKSCTSGDQCRGDCRVVDVMAVVPGRATAGTCQPTSDSFGCNARVESGVAQAAVCID